jgi:hypothetical protein
MGDTIAVEYQGLKRLGWLGTHYQVGLRESPDIMVDFYDDLGFLLRTDRFPVRRTAWATTSCIPVRQPFSKSRSQRQSRPIECGW